MPKKERPGKQTAHPERTCKDEVALVAAYLAASLARPVLEAFEEHLSQCADCRAFLRTYQKTIELTASFLRMGPPETAPVSFRLSPKVMSLIAAFYCGCIFLSPITV
jgi:hypothetical protein